MSIFGSMTTAVLGLSAQSKALGHISDNIANASTAGYKRVNTAFETLVLQSNQRLHEPGGVTAAPVFMNNIQGNLTQVQSATNAAIQGQGFFSVSKLSRGLTGPGQQGEMVQTQTGTLNADNVYYTRVGDFELDKNRYLVNSAGFALNGWVVDETTGQLKKDLVQPIQVNTTTDKPKATQGITLGANLPATPTPGVPIPSSSIQVYDTQGNARTIQFNWRQDSANIWRLGIDAPGSTMKPVDGTITGGEANMNAGVKTAGQTAVAQKGSVVINGTTTALPSSVTIAGPTNFYPNGGSQDNVRVGDKFALKVRDTASGLTTIASITLVDSASGTPAPLPADAVDISSVPDFQSVAKTLASLVGAPYKASINATDPRKIEVQTLKGDYPVEVSATCSNATATHSTTITGPATSPTGSPSGTQRSTWTFSNHTVDVGDEFRITVGSKEFRVRVTPNNDDGASNISIANVLAATPPATDGINAVVARLQSMINTYSAANPTFGVGATVGGAGKQLILDDTGSGTPFTTTPGTTDASNLPTTMQFSTPAAFTGYNATTVTAASGIQTDTLDFGATTTVKVPNVYSVSVGATTYTTEVKYSNLSKFIKDGNGNAIDGVIKDLMDQINLDSMNNGVTASAGTAGQLKLVGNAAGAFSSNASQTVIAASDNVRIGDKYTVTVDNVPYTVEVTENNASSMGTYDGILNAIAAKINSARPQASVIASIVDSKLQVTARVPGTPFTMDQEYVPAASTRNDFIASPPSDPTTSRGQMQEYSFPQTTVDIGDRYTVSINGIPIPVQVTQSNYSSLKDMSGVVQELANKINQTSGLNVTATATGGRLTITHNTALTGHFKSAVTIDNATTTSNPLIVSPMDTPNTEGKRQEQQITLTGSPGDVGAEYTVTVNGTPITYKTTGEELSMEDITTRLANMINKTSQDVTASAVGSVLNVVAKEAKTPDGKSGKGEFDLTATGTTGKTPAHVKLSFGTDTDNVGTITDISTVNVGAKGTAITSVNTQTGSDATITFTVDYGFGPQQITLNVGQFGKAGGVTQFAGSEINVRELVQDGASRGQYKEVVYGDNGDVIVNYDNGRSRVIGRIPIVTFNNPNALQREAGGVFIETDEGGRPNFNDPDTNGAGAVVANSVEASNVDIADEFTKLIVTQRTYSANTKIVTTSDEMLQEVLGLKR